MQLRKKFRGEAEVFTDALNDILFILLMFFLIVSTLANPNVIKLSQPKSKSDTKAKQNVVVSIDVNKQYLLARLVFLLIHCAVHCCRLYKKKRQRSQL